MRYVFLRLGFSSSHCIHTKISVRGYQTPSALSLTKSPPPLRKLTQQTRQNACIKMCRQFHLHHTNHHHTHCLLHMAHPQEFLEDRRVALEVALRRLTINAVQSDASVQAHLRAFLGFPPLKMALSGGAGAAARLAGVAADVARHLARVPVDLELTLPGGSVGTAPVPLLGNLRVVMWILLSGAAHKVGGAAAAVEALHTGSSSRVGCDGGTMVVVGVL